MGVAVGVVEHYSYAYDAHAYGGCSVMVVVSFTRPDRRQFELKTVLGAEILIGIEVIVIVLL